MSDIYVSASYTGCADNFKITGVQKKKNCSAVTHSFISILKNILMRSRTVKPSDFLISQLTNYISVNPNYIFWDASFLPQWRNTIKGADSGYNPASEFFYKIWPDLMPEYAWIRQLVVPEAKLEKILDVKDEKIKDDAVDFYLPLAGLVIEIDGRQHQSDNYQRTWDKRDRDLRRAGIKVIRIPTKIMHSDTPELITKINEIKAAISESEILNLPVLTDEDYNSAICYETAIRFQITILELIDNGYLDLSDKVWNFNIDSSQQRIFNAAAVDLLHYLSSLQTLYYPESTEISVPYICFVASGIKIYNTFHRQDERINDADVAIYTDYWNTTDYFHVHCGELLKYEMEVPVSDEKDSALKFFLKTIFGFDSFNTGQLQIIARALQTKTTIGILPTGSGKSLCYQLSALLQPGITLSVCPIVSLEIDQKRTLDEAGIKRTTMISSVQSVSERQKAIADIGSGRCLVAWITPERFQTAKFREQLSKMRNDFRFTYAVIDEVHCLSEWGHDFRTSYLVLINTIRKILPDSVLFGLTATASEAVLQDVLNEFHTDYSSVKAAFISRDNLSMRVIQTGFKYTTLRKVLQDWLDRRGDNYSGDLKSKETAIIFTLTADGRGGCSKLKNQLVSELKPSYEKHKNEQEQLTIDEYHGTMPADKKEAVQNGFIAGNIDILAATKAFGMGINKGTVSLTVHYGLPWSIEAFYQEAGRAGRNKKLIKNAECSILYTPEKARLSPQVEKFFMRDTSPDEMRRLNLREDLATIAYLWTSNNKGIISEAIEADRIISVFNKEKRDIRRNGFCFIKSEKEHEQPRFEGDKRDRLIDRSGEVEKALYYLRILNIVDDWEIDWRYNATVFKVYLNLKISEDRMQNALVNYISRIEPNANWERLKKKYTDEEKHIKHFSNKVVFDCLVILISWKYKHILYSRRRMIYNMKRLCDSYISGHLTPEGFKQEIENYLKISDVSVQLDTIVLMPNDWSKWLAVFYKNTIDEDGELASSAINLLELKNLYATASRFLESYSSNPGLNIIYVLSAVLTDNFDRVIDSETISGAFAAIDEHEIVPRQQLIEKITDLIYDFSGIINDEGLYFIIGEMLTWAPESARYINSVLHDDLTLSRLLNESTGKIKKILEGAAWVK